MPIENDSNQSEPSIGSTFPQIESDTDTGRQVGRQAGRREPSPEPDDRYQNQMTTALELDDDRPRTRRPSLELDDRPQNQTTTDRTTSQQTL